MTRSDPPPNPTTDNRHGSLPRGAPQDGPREPSPTSEKTHHLLHGRPQVVLLLLPAELRSELGEEVARDAVMQPAVLALLQADGGADPAPQEGLHHGEPRVPRKVTVGDPAAEGYPRGVVGVRDRVRTSGILQPRDIQRGGWR